MPDVVMGQVRALLAALSGYMLARGWADGPTLDLMQALAPLVVAMGWSWWAKRGGQP